MSKSFVLFVSFLISLNFVNSKTVDINWVIPDTDDPAKFPDKFTVGDVLKFNWPANASHNAYIHPNGGCDRTDAILIGDTTGFTYTVVEADIGQKVFACDIGAGNHCSRGQIIEATIMAASVEIITSAPKAMTPTAPPVEKEMADKVMDKVMDTEMETELDKVIDKVNEDVKSSCFQYSAIFQKILIALMLTQVV
mmetsp:Transcript_24875/g.28657  ORF Transcript_24875/g.28657 Transcript_24875/m.28657 type:complete len:195 (+) Transcript_24875:79-663(+)|eukprot:CAMPEP_0194379048 /NCGR_PEP_ID=MMETSP0174-20130528/37726_1 /TAXON_ID=216777 /ORGANISM="Proboscia alata, Strain PI-D3" /LENGTH=194 /DNA_ID=CAMNT_0039161495 /DNA_START=71 /DNA_END=655 /DNA_ORIENTATION=-